MSIHAYLFGVTISTPKDRVVNFILLFIKLFIYRQKLHHQGALSLIQLLRELRARLHIEKHLTQLENKPHRFTPWKEIYQWDKVLNHNSLTNQSIGLSYCP